MSAEGFSVARLGRFVRDNAALLALVPVLALVGTAIHELAHVVSVLAEGGTVLSVDWLPTRNEFHLAEVRWLPRVTENRPLIAMAPTVVWTCMALGTTSVARWVLTADTWSRIAVMVGFFLPIADATIGAAGLFCHAPTSDWSLACRGYELPVAVAYAAYVTVFGEVGLALVRRCWGDDALSPWEYSVGYLVALGLCALPQAL